MTNVYLPRNLITANVKLRLNGKSENFKTRLRYLTFLGAENLSDTL